MAYGEAHVQSTLTSKLISFPLREECTGWEQPTPNGPSLPRGTTRGRHRRGWIQRYLIYRQDTKAGRGWAALSAVLTKIGVRKSK